MSFSKALGELAIIVFGVLIALFAESAWNDYQDRLKGQAYLARLAAEAEANLALLAEDRAWARQSCSSTKSALALLQGEDNVQDAAAFLRFAVSASLYPNPRYQRVTYDDLVATGSLSLINDAPMREKIVTAYTEFFEALDSWRPPKDGPLRTAVLRTLPGEFIKEVVKDCIVDPENESWAPDLGECTTTPAAGHAKAMFSKLNRLPDLEGYLLERAWQTCEFENDMDVAAAPFVEWVKTLQ